MSLRLILKQIQNYYKFYDIVLKIMQGEIKRFFF